jgi:hypothetical protein
MNAVRHHDLWELFQATTPSLDLEQLQQLVTDDELHAHEGDCTVHDGCRPVLGTPVPPGSAQ